MKERKLQNGISKASFRDPSGFVFFIGTQPFRQINAVYREHYDHLMASGLYEKLLQAGLLIAHEEAQHEQMKSNEGYKIIKPECVRFLSYPYEWCFSQLKDAALVTLKIQRLALKYGMILKDASAYNIQFHQGKPVLIDTLSFEIYREGTPWVGYRQFCQFFLGPLALMSRVDVRLGQLLRIYMDGIPLDLASSLLPRSSYLRFSLLSHIHAHAKSQKRYAAYTPLRTPQKISRFNLTALMDNLESAVRRITWQPKGTEWADYYDKTNYSNEAFEHKRELVQHFVSLAKPTTVWDVGANTGYFSRIAAGQGAHTISFDYDPAAVEQNYRQTRQNHESNIMPLLCDLTNPSPAIGFQNQERMSLTERGPTDLVIALALIHHLCISNNVPLLRAAGFFQQIAKRWLIIEFVPKNDSQVQKLLATREDIFRNYDRDGFEESFGQFFETQEVVDIRDSQRTLYLMRTKA